MDRVKNYFNSLKDTYREHIPVYIALLLLGSGIVYLIFNDVEDKSMSECPREVNVEGSELQDSKNILIDVRGAIKSPGVYEVQEGTIIDNVIKLAGGLTPQADIARIDQDINFAKSLSDREKLFLPYKNSQPVSIPQTTAVSFTRKININSASSTELESLPGIGPSTAKKIIDGRPYKVINDLLEVSGIGPALLNKIKDKIEI